MRTVQINIASEELDRLVKVAGKEFHWAIGYLSLWGSAPSVTIYLQDTTDLLAVYRNGEREIVMGGVLDPNSLTYSFHM